MMLLPDTALLTAVTTVMSASPGLALSSLVRGTKQIEAPTGRQQLSRLKRSSPCLTH